MPDDPAWWNGLGPAFHAAIRLAERRGGMTYAELDAALPPQEWTSKQIEIVLERLAHRGITLVEEER